MNIWKVRIILSFSNYSVKKLHRRNELRNLKSKAALTYLNTPRRRINLMSETKFCYQQFLKHFINRSFLDLQCPDQSCKQDLLAYLEQIKLYSHQLKICSQVKAEIQNLGGELIMSAVSRKMV